MSGPEKLFKIGFVVAFFTAFAILVGCGKHENKATHTVTARAPGACAPAVPAHMGVCVQQHFGLTPRAYAPANGWDISVYQGSPSFPSSLRFVYNQIGDGASYRDPNFSSNCTREKHQGIRCGAYLFVRPGNAYGQALVIASVVRETNLPPALDVEVPGAYQELCPIAGDLKADFHVPVVVAYTAPGLWWDGPACGTELWAAEWGTLGYPFSGWSSYVAQQTCGTCVIDEDADHGLLVKPKPKPPSNAQLKRELYRDYGRRAKLRQLLTTHRCRTGHAKPARYRRACGVWFRQGATTNRAITALHRKGIY